jgi:hypothetical protein
MFRLCSVSAGGTRVTGRNRDESLIDASGIAALTVFLVVTSWAGTSNAAETAAPYPSPVSDQEERAGLSPRRRLPTDRPFF